jgi:hypothetical protein
MRPINEIILHCTATRPEWWASRTLNQKVAEVRRWHTEDRGWKDIGYHYLIDRDGKVATGRPIEKVGAHTQGRNAGTIGIALFGGHGSAVSDAFEANFTKAQDDALRALISSLFLQFGPLTVTGHNQYAAKACPGFDATVWFAGSGLVPKPVDDSRGPPRYTQSPLAAFIAAALAKFRRET